MEEKKKRPRLRASDPLEERNDQRGNTNDGSDRNSDERSDRFDQGENHSSRPYNSDQQDRPKDFNRHDSYNRNNSFQDRQYRPGGYNRDERPQGGGYNREQNYNRPPSDRPQGGGYNREQNYNRPPSDRPQGGGYNREQNFNRVDRPQGGGYGGNRGGGGYGGDNRSSGGYGGDNRGGGYGGNRGGGGYGGDNRGGGGYGGGNRGGGGYGGGNRGGGGGFNRGGGGGFNRGGGGSFRDRSADYVVPSPDAPKPGLPSGEGMQLNKYLAHCGLASRRKAVEFIEAGEITVNGKVIKEPFYRVEKGDLVLRNGQSTQIQERKVVLLFHKPKNVITTSEDERGRATVMQFIDPHYPERLYPVGRLDRDTTGLIVITNDGELAQKLSHPSGMIYKQYRVILDRQISQVDLEKVIEGFELEDGPFSVNWARPASDGPPNNIELEIVMGRNRIVRRIFEALGYKIVGLDRFYYGGLTKKNLPRGHFRELTDKEVIMLKHFSTHIPKVAEAETDASSGDL
jgi:23S rRNA pseudouridine2605 synthase